MSLKFIVSLKKGFVIARLVLVLYYIVSLSYRFSFLVNDANSYSNMIDYIFDYIVDFFFLFDMIYCAMFFKARQKLSKLNLVYVLSYENNKNTKQENNRKTVQNRLSFMNVANMIQINQAQTTKYSSYFFDFLSIIPFELIGYLVGYTYYPWLRLTKLFRLFFIVHYSRDVSKTLDNISYFQNLNIRRFCFFITSMALMAHTGACAFYSIR
jgi:hypothetical protein